MNTLAKLYKETQSLFYTQPASHQTEVALVNLVSAFVIDPYPVATVDLISKKKLKEADYAFWQALNNYGLKVMFLPQNKKQFALVTLQALPLEAAELNNTTVTEQLIDQRQSFKAAA